MEASLAKISRKDKLLIVHGEEKLQTILKNNESEDPRSLSSTSKTQFRPLSDIVTEESKYYPEHEEEKILEDDNEDLEMSEEEHLTSKQKVASKKLDKDAKYKRIETLNSLGYSAAQIAADSQVNMNIRTLKRIRSKIRAKGGIHRNEGSGRPVKLLDHHQKFIISLLNFSPFNTANRLASKLKSKYDWEVSRTTITRFLV